MWQTVSLGDVCTISSSKRIFAKEYQTEGIPFYRGKEVIEKHNGNSVSTELFISIERYEEIKSKFPVPKKGDILLTSVGTLGVPWLVDEEEFYFKDGNLTWLRCNAEILSEYLYLWLNAAEAQNQIDAKCIGSTQKALTIETLNKFQITLPSLEVQEKIVSAVKPIESRINNNRKINENLSDLLQAIYQEQFSDVSLSENQGILSDICSYSKAKVAVSELNTNTYFSTENMLPGKAGSIEATSLPAMTRTTACHKGDTLISNIRPYFKKIVYCEDVCGCSSDVLCFTPVQFQYAAYLFSTLYTDKFFTFMVAGSKGTKMPRGDKQQIMTYPLILPSEKELEEFNAVAVPVLEQLNYNRTENKRLSALRDALLPKLMSGELDVSTLDF